jgi:RNA polymerase sigma factor (sigma-70 family)
VHFLETDRAALDRILRDYAGFAFRLAASYEADPETVRDLTQDILMAVWQAWPAFRRQCSERTYVARIAHHRIATHVGKAVRQPRKVQLADDLPATEASPEEQVSRQHQRERLTALVRTLPVAYREVALLMLEEGASPKQVDSAIEAFGFAMGPFRMSDLAGNDISWHIRKRHYEEHPKMRRYPIADRVCEFGRFGQKTGLGWYRYEPGKRDAIPDPVVEQIIDEERKKARITPRRIPDSEIVDRLLYALVNEGARILEEGIAQRASDIDVVYLTGYGFPVSRGGPMYHASQVGLGQVRRRMLEFGWTPAKLITQLAAAGRGFDEAAGPKLKAKAKAKAKPARKAKAKAPKKERRRG